MITPYVKTAGRLHGMSLSCTADGGESTLGLRAVGPVPSNQTVGYIIHIRRSSILGAVEVPTGGAFATVIGAKSSVRISENMT